MNRTCCYRFEDGRRCGEPTTNRALCPKHRKAYERERSARRRYLRKISPTPDGEVGPRDMSVHEANMKAHEMRVAPIEALRLLRRLKKSKNMRHMDRDNLNDLATMEQLLSVFEEVA